MPLMNMNSNLVTTNTVLINNIAISTKRDCLVSPETLFKKFCFHIQMVIGRARKQYSVPG